MDCQGIEESHLLLTPSTRHGTGRCSSVSVYPVKDVGTVVVCVRDITLRSALYYSVGIVKEDTGTTEWGVSRKYSSGQHPSVCLIWFNEELYVLECHCSDLLKLCYYRVGKVSVQDKYIRWAPAKDNFLCSGKRPKITGNDKGVVVVIKEEMCTWDSLNYFIGCVRPQGMIIDWVTEGKETKIPNFEGVEPSIAINDKDQVVVISRSSGNIIKARLGILLNIHNNLSILWTGSNYRLQTAGKNPSISLNSDGNIVEIHQTNLWKQLSTCCGRVSKSSIVWGEEKTINNGEYPTVSLSGDGVVFEMHASPLGFSLFFSQGVLEGCVVE